MKATFAVLAVAGVVSAQSLSDLPPCGQTCVNNMVAIGSSDFGCAVGNVTCYCTNQDFGYGMRDCANEACPDPETANSVIQFGTAYCRDALSGGNGASGTGALGVLTSALSGSGASAPAPTGSPSASGNGDDDDDDNSTASSTPVTTSAVVSTVTSDGSTYETTVGSTTIFGAVPLPGQSTDSTGGIIGSATDSAGSVIASATDSAGSVISSATESAGSVISSATDSAGSVISSATQSGDEDNDSTSTGGAGQTSTGAGGDQTTGAAPIMTAAPMAGAIGMAAWLLI